MSDTLPTMIKHAEGVLNKSYSPYSNFKVSCCIEDEDGILYLGVNVENASYGLSTCAETSAISQLITSGNKLIKQAVIMNGDGTLCPPCGACRQRLIEFSKPDTLIHLCDHNKVLKTLTMDELLPYAFKL